MQISQRKSIPSREQSTNLGGRVGTSMMCLRTSTAATVASAKCHPLDSCPYPTLVQDHSYLRTVTTKGHSRLQTTSIRSYLHMNLLEVNAVKFAI